MAAPKRCKGAQNGNTKLTDIDVYDIKFNNEDMTFEEIGDMYGVSKSCVSAIRRNVTWRHIKQQDDCPEDD